MYELTGRSLLGSWLRGKVLMFGPAGRPPCHHRRVTEADDVGSTPRYEPTAYPIVYKKAPETNGFKVFGGIAIALVVISLVVVLGFALSIYNSFGGVSHDPTDSAVRATRMKADPTARSELDVVIDQLSPALGPPAKRALIDTCWDTYQSETLNNDITCGRSLYLYYPMPLGKPPLAWNLSEPLTSNWSPDQYKACVSPAGATKWCLKGTSSNSVLQVQVNSADAGPRDRYPKVQGDSFPTEMDGYRELVFSSSQGPCVVVMYQLTYFEG
jgi:hypothetical protein